MESPLAFTKLAHMLWPLTCLFDKRNVAVFGEEAMWMRSCAVCKSLMIKLRLRDSVRCRCGWEWEW